MRSTKPQFHASKKDICDTAKILNKFESPSCEAIPLAFFTSTRNQKLFAQLAIPPEEKIVESPGLQDNELKEVTLGRPTQNTT